MSTETERAGEADLRVAPADNRYRVSSDGHIYSTRKPSLGLRRLSEQPMTNGYLYVQIPDQVETGVTKLARVPVGRWVAEAFIGPRPVGQQIRHLDGVRTNNAASNLSYGTAKQNIDDRAGHGTTAFGERNGMVVVPDAAIPEALRRVSAGETAAAVARSLGVHPSTVQRWTRGAGRSAARLARELSGGTP